MNMIRKIRAANNRSLCIAIPREVLNTLNLTKEDKVEYKIQNGKVVIEKAKENLNG